ncbi:ABC transporter substrate-binding protein [Corynebacterium godavarianum]|uniref:ABC transporter substrate-binding protein n=2 Tax=Corynebacterium TaxID=1716 RepID=A0ABY3E6Y8_9CORY|nr:MULTISPECIES: ABC transporter substrate-binding protein [Corynebacterium]MBL7285589.1 ABC transporter substrate-binding protein [Corynebacterium godavarianum]PAT09018.1 ferrisiderophore receptor Irp6A [Corynebacterium hadale]PAT10773.1 ferrisiderophore receptor Irp6A [Corynebacterium hadale]TSJ75551.1 ABC transporter substrate-binding protein [Corynebacterium godavarianum]
MKLFQRAGALLVSAATVLGLAACSGSDDNTAAVTETQNASSSAARSADAVHITDAAGRTLDFEARPERIVLAEGRAVYATATLQDNPFNNVVAYGDDLNKAAPALQEKLLEDYPEAKDMPMIGSIQKGDVTAENLLAQKPDVIIMTLDQKKASEENGFLSNLDALGIKYAFIDFRQKPLENTTVSMTMLGELLGQQERAEKFNAFYDEKVKTITDRVANIEDRPDTLVWTAAGFQDCCSVAGDVHLGTLVTAAGGHNLGPEVLGTDSTQLTPEKLVEINPEKLIVTGGEWASDPSKSESYHHVELGYQADEQTAIESCSGPLKIPGIDLLDAPKNGNYFAVYHQFYDNPFNVFALEAFAKWLHPEEFEDMDPAADFEQFHKDFLPYEYSGAFFADPNSETS